MSRYLVGLAERGGAEEIAGPAVALTRAEQRELLAALRALRAGRRPGRPGSGRRKVAGTGDAAPERGDGGAAEGPTAETVGGGEGGRVPWLRRSAITRTGPAASRWTRRDTTS